MAIRCQLLQAMLRVTMLLKGLNYVKLEAMCFGVTIIKE